MYYTQEQTNKFDEQNFAFLVNSIRANCLTITINRPEKKNALHPVLLNELAYTLAYAKTNPDIWAVVLAANGNVFCAGADLKAFMGASEVPASTIPKPNGQILLNEIFRQLCKPCIAQVQGDVYAGGFLLMTGCTYVVAEKGLKFGLPEVKRGIFPFQVMAGLIEVMPKRKVIDWCIRGYNLPVEEALNLGLITHIAEKDGAEIVVQKLLDELKMNSPSAIRMGLEAYNHINPSEDKQQYLMNMLMKTLQTKDAQEGIKAFKEKRAPKWSGA